MDLSCSYCKCGYEEGALKCRNCGAPIEPSCSDPADLRSCPFCHRKLLTLVSPACNYCGRALPENYVHARQAIGNLVAEPKTKADNERMQAVASILKVNKSGGTRFSLFDLFDLTDLFT